MRICYKIYIKEKTLYRIELHGHLQASSTRLVLLAGAWTLSDVEEHELEKTKIRICNVWIHTTSLLANAPIYSN